MRRVRIKAQVLLGALVASAAVLAPSVVQATPVFVNGDFSSGQTGWTFSGGSFVRTVVGNAWAWVGRLDQPYAQISQTVGGFTIGATYELTFLLATESFNYNGTNRGDTVNVAIAGTNTINQDFTQSAGSGCCWNVWEQQNYSFVADASSLTFTIHGYPGGHLGYNSADAGVDQFGLAEVSTSVPEPTSLALIGLGLAGLGLARRKKRL